MAHIKLITRMSKGPGFKSRLHKKTNWYLDLMVRATTMSGYHRFKCYRNYYIKKKNAQWLATSTLVKSSVPLFNEFELSSADNDKKHESRFRQNGLQGKLKNYTFLSSNKQDTMSKASHAWPIRTQIWCLPNFAILFMWIYYCDNFSP